MSHSASVDSPSAASAECGMPSLSVVICTYDRYDELNDTVDRLIGSSDFVATGAEMLVVENTPAPRRQAIDMPNIPLARVVVCDTVGLSAARNFGIEHATGDIIAFLDDDALVCHDWCATIIEIFAARPQLLVAGGKVTPRYTQPNLPAWYDSKLSGYLSCIDWSPRGRFLRPGEWIVGANMAFRRSVFEKYGLFNTSLGRKGAASLLSNEEIALLEQIGMGNVFYEPRMAVEHMIPSDRLVPAWFRRRVFWQAVSDMVAGLVKPGDPALRREYGQVFSQLEANRRNLDALNLEPRSFAEFQLQLRGIYLASVTFGGGV